MGRWKICIVCFNHCFSFDDDLEEIKFIDLYPDSEQVLCVDCLSSLHHRFLEKYTLFKK